MQKITKILVIMLLFFGLSTPKDSKAIIGIATGNPTFVIAGASCGLLGIGISSSQFLQLFGSAARGSMNHSHISEALFDFGLWATLAGVILLDEQIVPNFHTLDKKLATQLGITTQQIDIFNSEIDILNVITEEALTTNDFNQSVAIWRKHKDDLSPETLEVIAAITNTK